MNYPNGIKKETDYIKQTTSKRGMSLEEDINKTNRYYLSIDKAVIYKKPTPISIVHVDYPSRKNAKIDEAYFTTPSTTDYNGVYKSKYIDFEAKECKSKTSFPLALIHNHQINHLRNVLNHGAIAFIIIRMTAYDKDYVILAKDLFDYFTNCSQKSLPYEWIKNKGYEIISNYIKPCDYLEIIDRIYEV